jgi:glycosyltransferase involved in cell wall biosynthesis
VAEPTSQPVRVAIDVTSLIGERTGVGHVTAAFVEHLAHRDDVSLVAYAVTGNVALAHTVARPPGIPLRVTRVPARVLLTAWRSTGRPRIERWTGPVDVVHGTNFVVPPTRAAALATVHGVAFLRDPHIVARQSRRYVGLLRAAVHRGATIQVFSDVVASEVQARLGVAPSRVVRIYPGIASEASPRGAGGDAGKGHDLAGADRYVLALGTIEPRKNLPRLIEAFDNVAETDPTLQLVVAGPDGWGTSEFAAAVRAAPNRDRIRRVGYVDDVARRDLLAGATVLAYPSLDEGFGHPPLEAMKSGVPVVAARAGALPEILGDAALLVDPLSVEELAAALRLVVSDADTSRRLVAAGIEQAGRYSWRRATDDLVACYRRLTWETARDRLGNTGEHDRA